MGNIEVDRTAEFKAESHFNLHIEGAGSANLYKRMAGDGWSFVATLVGDVIDEDVQTAVPKEYRVVCAKKPSMLVATINGGKAIYEIVE